MRKYTKIWIIWISWIMILIIWGLIWKYGYNYSKYGMIISTEELENRKIDEYNFWELEKVKSVLSKMNQDNFKFRSLTDFNEKYNQDIKPIKNCYYLVSTNYFDKYKWNSKYIFWFKLYSDKFKKKYWEKDRDWIIYYSYPKYDLPYDAVCFGLWEWGCSDFIYGIFLNTISNPCQD